MSTTKLTKVNSYLTFKIGDELYASNVKNVINIVEMSKITRVPRCPDYMLGIINLRGMVLPVIDARKKFGLPPVEYTVNTCILVLEVIVNNNTMMVGALVDGVKEVIEINDSQISEPPSIGISQQNYFITGVFKGSDEQSFVMILDMDSIFSTTEVVEISQVASHENQQ